MKLLSSWSCWSVEQFLEQENWHGETQNNPSIQESPLVVREAFPEQFWSAISVEKFLNLGNWDGKQKPSNTFPMTAEVRGIVFGSSWLSLSVEQFLGQENWNGIHQQPSPQVSPQPQVTSQFQVTQPQPLESGWSALRVGQFFENVNWRGRPWQNSKDTQNPVQLDFKLSVADFFGSVIWEGKPEIGILPQPEPESEVIAFPASAKEATVDDLFDIF